MLSDLLLTLSKIDGEKELYLRYINGEVPFGSTPV